MKAKTLLVAALMFFAFTAAAYSQAFFQVGSTPVTAVIKTGYSERAGDITFTTVTGQTTANGTITVSYGVHITNLAGTNGIQINTAAWVPAAGTTVVPTILSVANGAGQVVINVPTGGSGTFSLSGVRVAVYPNYTSGNLIAQLSASQNSNSFVAGQNQAVVITNVNDGITVSTTAGTVNYGTGATTNPVIKIKEGFLDAFGRGSGVDITQTTGLMLRITLSGAPPTGYTLVFPATSSTNATTPAVFNNVTASVTTNSDGTTKAVTDTAAAVTVDSTHLQIYYLLNTSSQSDPTLQETLSITPTLSYTGTALPPPPASISYTVTLAPLAASDGVKTDGTLTADLLTPRFFGLEISGGTLFGVGAGTGTTNMLIPFASYVATSGYTTGIAIANTSLDPGTTVLFGTGSSSVSAIPQPGTITFYFYPQITSTSVTSVTSYTYTTQAGSPGIGLNASGQVIPGSTYAVQVEQLLAVAGYPSGADFNGYIIAKANFPNAHCQYIITDFKAFANGGQAMIIQGSRTSPEALNH